MGEGGAYLLDGRVLDGVGVVMVVNDFKVPHGLTLGGPSKVHVQLGLAGSLGQHREVRGLSNFHTWRAHPKTAVRAWRTLDPTPASLPRSLPGHPPVRFSPGPSALTLLASWDGSTLMWKGLAGISWVKERLGQGGRQQPLTRPLCFLRGTLPIHRRSSTNGCGVAPPLHHPQQQHPKLPAETWGQGTGRGCLPKAEGGVPGWQTAP